MSAVMTNFPIKSLHYTQSLYLNRAHEHRLDEDWLSNQRTADDAEVILMHDGKFLVETVEEAPHISQRMNSQPMEDLTLLGLQGEQPIFAAHLVKDTDESDNCRTCDPYFPSSLTSSHHSWRMPVPCCTGIDTTGTAGSVEVRLASDKVVSFGRATTVAIRFIRELILRSLC